MAKKFSKNVEVCLLKDIDTLGKKGDIKRVKMGYFANFLLPQKLAILAAKKVKAEKTKLELKKKKKKEDYLQGLSAFVEKLPLTLTLLQRANKKGKLYSDIKEQDIIRLLKADDFVAKIDMGRERIDRLGSFQINILFKNKKKKKIKLVIKEKK